MISAVIVDTNIVVAGLLTARSDSPVARILDGMLAARFAFVLSDALLAEYRNVLIRPALRKAHGLNADEIDRLLVALVQHAIVLAPGCADPAPDPGDQHLWDLLAARIDLHLVTGDKLLLEPGPLADRIITAQVFAEQLT